MDAQVSTDGLSAYAMQGSRYAPIQVPVSGNATISISPTVQNQIVIATVAASNYTITFPAVTVAAKNMRVLVMRQGATAGILSLAGLNNFGGTVRLFNDQDCAMAEVVQTGPSTYAWEITSVLTTGNYSPSGSSFTVQPGDMIRQFNITTGGSNFTLTLSAGSSAPLGEYIVAKVDSGTGAVALTPNTGDAFGSLAANTVFYLVNLGDSVHIKSNGVTGYNFVADYSGGTLERYTVEGGFSVAAGAVVEILADGNIKQFRRYTAAPLDLSLSFQTGRVKIVPLTQTGNGGGTAVAFYTTSSTVMTAVVLTITADLVVTAGTPISVGTVTTQTNYIDAVALSSTLVLFTYQAANGGAQTIANTVSISGTTLTLNAAANNPDATCFGGVLQFVSSTSAVWMGMKTVSTNYYFSARIISVSGTTITWNGNSDSASTGTTNYASVVGYPGGIINKAGNQCYYLTVGSGAATALVMATWWISGTTVTFKTYGSVVMSPGASEVVMNFGAAYPGRSLAQVVFTELQVIGVSVKMGSLYIAEQQINAPPSLPAQTAGYLPLPPLQGTNPSAGQYEGAGIDSLATDCIVVGGLTGSAGVATAGYSPAFMIIETGFVSPRAIAEPWFADTTHAATGAWVARLTDDISICAWTRLYGSILRCAPP